MTSSNKPVSEEKTTPRVSKRIVLITATVTYFFFGYIFSSVNIALPAIDREFHADAILLSWISTITTLASCVLLIPSGKVSDIVGLKKMYAYGVILYTICGVLGALSVSIQMLIAIRLVQGISAAMVVGNAVALVSIVYPAGERGRALGITSAAVYTGTAVAPLLGGTLTDHFGWRSIFFITVPAGLIILWLIFWKIKGEWQGSKGERLDIIGSAIFGLAIIASMYGLSILPDRMGIVLIPVGILIFLGFLRWEARTTSPILNINIFRNNRVFVFTSLTSFMNYAATFGVIFLMSLYLQYIKGFNAETAGLIMVSEPALQAILSPLAGRLSDKYRSPDCFFCRNGNLLCCTDYAQFFDGYYFNCFNHLYSCHSGGRSGHLRHSEYQCRDERC